MKKRLIIIAPLAVLGVLLFITLGGTIVQWLWNWLLPSIVGWRPISFWQALGVLALCRILFGGLGIHRGGGAHSPIRHRMADRMADRVAERWDRMTPEERERFRQRVRERCGFDPSGGASPTP